MGLVEHISSSAQTHADSLIILETCVLNVISVVCVAGPSSGPAGSPFSAVIGKWQQLEGAAFIRKIPCNLCHDDPLTRVCFAWNAKRVELSQIC